MLNRYKTLISNFIAEHKKGIKILVFVLIVGGTTFRGLMQIPAINEGRKQIAELQKQIEYEELRRLEIQELQEKVNTDEYIEKIASEKLGLIKNNAKIFVDVSAE